MNENNVTVRSYLAGLGNFTIKLMVKPVDFFRTMPKSGGFLDPLLYIVVAALLGVLLNTIESFVSHGVGIHDLGILFTQLVIVPLIAVILSFFFASIFFVLWSFIGSQENYQTSYRCLAYMQIVFPVTILLSILPYLGLLGIGWWLYMMVIASKEVHKVPVRSALVIFGIIAAIPALVYYNSVSSILKTKQHLQEFTQELQKMPGKNGPGNSGQ